MNPKDYINPDKCKTFAAKNAAVQELINHTLFILETFGIPLDSTPRRLERMAIAFLAVSDIKTSKEIQLAKNLSDDAHAIKTREIIEYVNVHFQENISSGSYDNIRRKDLKLLLAAEIVLQSSPTSATNDSTRGYGLNQAYAKLLKNYPSKGWSSGVKKQLKGIKTLSEKLKRKRNLDKIPIVLSSSKKLKFSIGLHNVLQKSIVEQFLPIYGYGAEVLYIGDTSNKYLHLNQSALEKLNFFKISHDELPDIIAYSKAKNWLYLIEAVHSSGAINELRLLQLKKLTKNCKADIIYITAFLDRKTFRKFIGDIAWETEVWIADNPEHLIHFNGDKFLGPYQKKITK